MATLPVIDLSGTDVPRRIEAACRESGFFYVTGHGVPDPLFARLEAASREFFALPEADKREIAMARGGRAWRGYFPIGAELTSGRPDHIDPSHTLVQDLQPGTPPQTPTQRVPLAEPVTHS